LTSWYNTIANSNDGYIPGFYENSESTSSGTFENSFCSAGATIQDGSYLYSQQPQYGSSFKESAAPTTYSPQHQGCEQASNVYGWQYLINGPNDIDVDEFTEVGLW